MKRTYEHSGAMGMAPLLLPAIGIPGVIVLGTIYTYAMVYSPLVILSIFIVIVYGIGLAGLMMIAGKVAKCRNGMILGLLGAAIGLFAFYSQWASFLAALLGKSDMESVPGYVDFLLNPQAMWNTAQFINETGWYSISDATPSGILLWIFWGCEAVLVVGAVAFGAVGAIADEVFCEDCGQWCDEVPGPMLTFPEDDAEFQQVIAGDLNVIEQIDPPFEGQPAYLQVELKRCGECQLIGTYQVKVIKHGFDDEGKPTTETETLTPQYLTDADGFRRIEALVNRPLGPMPT